MGVMSLAISQSGSASSLKRPMSLEEKANFTALVSILIRLNFTIRFARNLISQSLQVVYYDQVGHYHAHFDSETHEKTEIPCCHQQEEEKMLSFEHPCRLCRLDHTHLIKYADPVTL